MLSYLDLTLNSKDNFDISSTCAAYTGVKVNSTLKNKPEFKVISQQIEVNGIGIGRPTYKLRYLRRLKPIFKSYLSDVVAFSG